MKSKKILIALLALSCALTTTACGASSGQGLGPKASEQSEIPSFEPSQERSQTVSEEPSEEPSSEPSEEPSQGSSEKVIQTLSFDGKESVAECRAVALGTVKNHYASAVNTDSLSEKQKDLLGVAYDTISIAVLMTDGTSVEVKAKLNGLYATFQTFVDTLQSAKSTFEAQKEQALAEIETVYTTLSSTFTQEATALKNAYEEAKATIEALKNDASVQQALSNALSEFVAVAKDKATESIKGLIANKKTEAKAQLDSLVENALSHLEDPVKTELQDFYDTEIAKFDEVEDLADLDDVAKEVVDDTKQFVVNKISAVLTEIKKQAKDKLDEAVGKLLDLLPDGELKTELNGFYQTEIGKIEAIDSIDEAKTTASEVLADTEAEVKKLSGTLLAAVKTEAKEKLDEAVGNLLDLLPDGELKTELNGFYQTEIGKIEAIDSIDEAKTTASEVLADTEAEVKKLSGELLTALKTEAKEKLDGIVENGLKKIKNQTIRNDINEYYQTEIGKIEAIDSIDEAKTTANEVLSDTKEFVLGKLKTLLGEIKGLSILQQVVATPDVWEYMPSALHPEAMAYSTLPANDFSSFVNVSAIGTKFVGNNLKTVVDAFEDTEKLMKATATIGSAVEKIAEVYQTFIDEGEGDLTEFVGEAVGFKVKISLSEDKTEILIGNATVNAEYVYDKENETLSARVQATGGVAGKFESSENELHVAIQLSVAGVGTFRELDLAKSNGTVEGTVYSRTGNSKLALNGNTYFVADQNTVRVTSNKRYAGVLSVTASNETYDSKTGKFIGGEIEETNGATDFDTFWYQLCDVSGFNTVQCGAEIVVDQETGEEQTKSSTTKVNGASKEFTTIKVNPINPLSSRRFYIESVRVYYYLEKTDGGETTYELTKVNVPLLFVQKGQTGSFGSDVKSKNGSEFAQAPVLPDISLVTDGYAAGKENYTAMKDKKISDITDYIGEENSFFGE